VVSGLALAAAGAALLWLAPQTPMLVVLCLFVPVGLFLGLVNPPISNTAVSGMPRSMAGLAASLASSGRQTGTAFGVAIAGAVVGPSLGRGGSVFTSAAQSVWWMLVALGLALAVLAVLSTGRWAAATAARASAPAG
jgi:hypothetical protein